MSILIFFIILFLLVLVHEFGHFIVAKKSGIRVDEFGFGFPPRALTLFKKGETIYTLNWLPFGGFVKIYGEDAADVSPTSLDAGRSMIYKKKRVQAAVLVAGVVFNFLLAWLLLSGAFVAGMPASGDFDPNASYSIPPALTLTSVVAGSPAALAGLKTGDVIVAVDADGTQIKQPSIEAFQTAVASHADKAVTVEYKRGTTDGSLAVTPKPDATLGHAAIGVSIDMVGVLKLPFGKAFLQGARLTWTLTAQTAITLAHLIRDSVFGHADFTSLTGPVGLVGAVGDAYAFGFVHLVMLAALISINLGIINLVPFPALDGGRLLFLLIEKIKGSPINPKVAGILNTVGFFLLIALMLVVTYHDIVRLIR
jgi:regulator of sigma E protease